MLDAVVISHRHADHCADLPVATCATRHPVPTLSLRWPSLGLVYTADTALHAGLIRFSAGASLLLTEATYASEAGRDLHTHGHMSGAHFAEVGAIEATRRAAEAEYGGPTVVVEGDGCRG